MSAPIFDELRRGRLVLRRGAPSWYHRRPTCTRSHSWNDRFERQRVPSPGPPTAAAPDVARFGLTACRVDATPRRRRAKPLCRAPPQPPRSRSRARLALRAPSARPTSAPRRRLDQGQSRASASPRGCRPTSSTQKPAAVGPPISLPLVIPTSHVGRSPISTIASAIAPERGAAQRRQRVPGPPGEERRRRRPRRRSRPSPALPLRVASAPGIELAGRGRRSARRRGTSRAPAAPRPSARRP